MSAPLVMVFEGAALKTKEVLDLALMFQRHRHTVVALIDASEKSFDVANTKIMPTVPAEELPKLLAELGAKAFWTTRWPEVEAARGMGISTCFVGNDQPQVTTLVMVESQHWGLKIAEGKTDETAAD